MTDISSFYTDTPYPWRPAYFDRYPEGGLAVQLLNQDVGLWSGSSRLSSQLRIWVAGAGANQGVITALRYPESKVLATDVSPRSLEIAALTANQLGISNLELQYQNIADARYSQLFDLVICTGVVHHNADPESCVAALARSMRVNAVLEIMVYNEFHRGPVRALQALALAQAVTSKDLLRKNFRNWCKNILEVTTSEPLRDLLMYLQADTYETFVDTVLNPLEQAYTVHGLGSLLDDAGLELRLPVINQFDVAECRPLWWSTWDRLNTAASSLDKFQVHQSCLYEKSPMLWFYAQHRDSTAPDVNAAFAELPQVRPQPIEQCLIRHHWRDGQFDPKGDQRLIMPKRPKTSVADIYKTIKEGNGQRDFASVLGPVTSRSRLGEIQAYLLSSAFPFFTTSETVR